MRVAVLILTALFFILTPCGAAEGKTQVVVVANSIDYALASDFLGFLQGNFDVIYSAASTFSAYQSKSFIIILGGPDAYEGVGEIVRGKLTMAEQEYLRVGGNRNMYVLTDAWAENQAVFIIAGSDRNQTKMAAAENEDAVNQKILAATVSPAETANVSLEGGVSIYAGEVGSPFSYWGFERHGSYITINLKSTISINTGDGNTEYPMMTYTFEKLPARIRVDDVLYDVLYVDNAKIIVKRVYE